MMKTYLYQAAFAACLFLTACNESKTTDGEITVIPVGAALDAPSGLKASDYFKQEMCIRDRVKLRYKFTRLSGSKS